MHLEHRMDDLPTPIRHTAHGNMPESCRISSPSPEAMNFVLVMFTWRPLDSNPSFHALTRSTHSSREVAMITRSSAKNSSQGTPTLKSLDKASSTMIKSSGLRTEPWCTPTPTCSTMCSGADQRKHQSSASLAFVRGIHRSPVNSPHKVPATRKCFHLMTSSCVSLPVTTKWAGRLPTSTTRV